MKTSRRDFIKTAGSASALLSVGGVLPGFSAESYQRIVGANELIRMSIIGVNGRGTALSSNFARMPGGEVVTICDCDQRAITACMEATKKNQAKAPKGERDFRRSLADKTLTPWRLLLPTIGTLLLLCWLCRRENMYIWKNL